MARAHRPLATYACSHMPLDTCIPPATNNLAAASADRQRRCCRLGLLLPGSSAPNPPYAPTSDSAARSPAVSRQGLTRWHCTPGYYLLVLLLARADGPQEHEAETGLAGACPQWQEPRSCHRCCWRRICKEVRAAMFDHPRAQSRKPALTRMVCEILCCCVFACVCDSLPGAVLKLCAGAGQARAQNGSGGRKGDAPETHSPGS